MHLNRTARDVSGLNIDCRPPARAVRLRGLDPAGLGHWLGSVTAHLSTDPTEPAFLGDVAIRLSRGGLHAMATDRYTGAISTLAAPCDQDALVTIPGGFARRVAEHLGADEDAHGGVPESVDVTITPTLFALTIHRSPACLYWGSCSWDCRSGTRLPDEAHLPLAPLRLAVRLDPHAETVNLPRVAARALAEPAGYGPFPLNTVLLSRFLDHAPVQSLDPLTGRLTPGAENVLEQYTIHPAGHVLVLTRPGFLGFIAGVRRSPDRTGSPAPVGHQGDPREAWRTTLAALA